MPSVPTKHSRISITLRLLLTWFITAAGLLLIAWILPGFSIPDVGDALFVAALIGLVNALVWPTVIRVALPLTVLTFGFGVLLLNGVVIWMVAEFVDGVHIDGAFEAVVIAIGLAVINTAVTGILAIDDDDFYYRQVIRKRARKQASTVDPGATGIYFLEIDGLAHEVLRRAMRDGNAPNLARWIHSGSHVLERWETDLSSQTGACQAGILHGNNRDIPAFRWWEKDDQRALVTNHPRDAAEIEARISDGRGLLHLDGASRANILSGDAPHSLLTMSTILTPRREGSRIGNDYFAYFANPYNLLRTVALVPVEVVREQIYAAQQRRRDVRPRVKRGFKYSLIRAYATVVQLDLQVSAVISDMYAGRPVGYTTFLAYDEVAHHSGVERPDTLAVLARVDRQIGRIARAADEAGRPYEFVVLADHGQSQGATFLARYGETLQELVNRACGMAAEKPHGHTRRKRSHDEAGDFLRASLAEAIGSDKMAVTTAADEGVGSSGTAGEHGTDPEAGEIPETVVMASGCLGLVSFPRLPGRTTLEEMEAAYPQLVATLAAHPGVGFVLVRSSGHGAMAVGREGINYLEEERVEGTDPLEVFGPNAARHLLRHDSFSNCPDLVLNSSYWPDTDEVAAFEELVGSHGGLGGEQCFPFVIAPSGWARPDDEVEMVGAEAVHQRFRGWLADLGHNAYGENGAAGVAVKAPPQPPPSQRP